MKQQIFQLKKSVSMNSLVILSLIFLFTITAPATTLAQDAKVDKAEANFCKKLENLIIAYDALLEESTMGTDQEFEKAYNKTVKAWNKFVKSAQKLEKVEYQESEKAYNDLVDAVNLIDSGATDNKTAGKVNKHIKSASDAITSLQAIECK